MSQQPASPPPAGLPTTAEAEIRLKPVRIGRRSRLIIWLMRRFLRPMLSWMLGGSNKRMARIQLSLAAQVCRDSSGLPVDYRVVGRVPGHFIGGAHDPKRRVVLWLHGGAFILPAVPDVHVRAVAKICRALDAVGFLPDYRLAPFNKFPAALDDCERAYRGLLDLATRPSASPWVANRPAAICCWDCCSASARPGCRCPPAACRSRRERRWAGCMRRLRAPCACTAIPSWRWPHWRG